MRLETDKYSRRETAVAEIVSSKWKCDFGRMGPYSPFDVYFLREKRLKSIAEIRTRRDRELLTYRTVLVDLDKWFSLLQAELCLRIPAFYIIAFTDGVYFVRIGHIRASELGITYKGRADRPQAVNDLSPVLEVPSETFSFIGKSEGVFENMAEGS